MNKVVPIFLVFFGCCSNLIFLEYLIRDFPGSGNLITFSHFLFISLEGFIFTSKCFTVSPKIPLREYVTMVMYFFFVQVFQNYALSFNVSMPLQMIFRAGSMMSSLILGVIILKRKYSLEKYISVFLITVGIAVSTIASSQVVQRKSTTKENSTTEDESKDMLSWSIGIAMLTIGLFMSAGMGIFQEKTYSKYGKHPREALFYNHFLPLPGFLFLMSDIAKYANLLSQTEPVVLLFGISLPKMILMLIGNALTQYICIRSVFVLTTECTSLEVTLIVTLRKFISIVISIIHFQNPFTPLHWLGTVLVFVGTLMFTEILSLPRMGRIDSEKKEK